VKPRTMRACLSRAPIRTSFGTPVSILRDRGFGLVRDDTLIIESCVRASKSMPLMKTRAAEIKREGPFTETDCAVQATVATSLDRARHLS
jgi:hypothetical protein